MKLAADDPERLLHIVPLLLLAGKDEEYRQLCVRLLKTRENATDKEQRQTANWIVRMCGLNPQAADDPDRVLRLAREAFDPLDDQSAS